MSLITVTKLLLVITLFMGCPKRKKKKNYY